MSPQNQHWLAELACRAQLPNAATLDCTPTTPESLAWSGVASHVGCAADQLARAVAPLLGVCAAEFASRDDQAARLLPEKVARRLGVVPMREDDRTIVVATANPLDPGIEQGVAFASGRTAVFELADPESIEHELARTYGQAEGIPMVDDPEPGDATLDNAVELVDHTAEDTSDDDPDAAPVIRLTNLILRSAVQGRASDVHFEPSPGEGLVRFRVDGVLRVHTRLPLKAMNRVVSRIKVLGRLDIADKLRPQDGRSRLRVDGVEVDLRISTVPTRDAEKAVVRLLRHDATQSLEGLSLGAADKRKLRQLIGHRNGVVIVTGPTGSGKTTTLYACIRELASGETNISTVEDPIEYELPGITQMQVETKRDFTFASALRAILRQDPDVILVGEVRDLETAEIAIRASMTGHLVLTTLHTNDAASALARLADIGVERNTVASSLRGVVAQRLVRRLCEDCAEPVDALIDEEASLAARYGIQPTRRARGCERCGGTGYRGRLAIVEIMAINPTMQELISRGVATQELEQAAWAGGMASMRQSALQRVLAGETTLQEIERVVGEELERAGPTSVPGTPPGPPPPTPAAPQGRVLVVEDNDVVRRLACHHLRDAGYEPIEARDAGSALSAIAGPEALALCLLDLTLPDATGDAVLERIRSTPATSRVPVVVMTGDEDEATELRLLGAGADDYLRKPLEPRRLVARVQAAIRRSQAA